MSGDAPRKATVAYRLFGLTIACYRPIAGLDLRRIDAPVAPDVEIFGGGVAMPATIVREDRLELAQTDDGLFLRVPSVARFLIQSGCHITVSRDDGVADDVVDLFLTGTVLGAILHQRALLPIHCNAVRIGASAFLFCGDSGAGKSTLAAWFEARGYDLFTDDLCAVRFDPAGRPLACAGLPRLRLWRESITALGRGREVARALPWEADKFELTMARLPAAEELPIAGIYHLQIREDIVGGVEPLSGLGAVEAITSSIYRRRVADHLGRTPGYLADALRLIRAIPAFAFARAWTFSSYEEEARGVENHALQLEGKRRIFLENDALMRRPQTNDISKITLINPNRREQGRKWAI